MPEAFYNAVELKKASIKSVRVKVSYMDNLDSYLDINFKQVL